ncbi:hypothetical protein KC331_g3693 [Hortaea werneckii]|uniref:J domain-containing protein n=1 Tax=Hortaea werneckii TaxID=91943 RepID=A0A3M7CJ97_HORWE|nr:hypothetical protein KC331_g3693 [Hortaea werneckii]KAI7699157.1 hypothetical protein KC353_g16603 [Hortaea werneckii]RMY52125.1 hypothetical protein D0865_05964 [Hortaea werneckii]
MFARSGLTVQRPAGVQCPRPDLFFRPSAAAAAVVLGGGAVGRAPRQLGRRPFHISTPRRQESANNFYEVLDLPTTASPGEIKKQFYKLSKAHHPDLHPEDPHAAQRFVRISEAHATLGSPEKKEKYDRDVVRPSQAGPSGGGGGAGAPPGSFSSSSSTGPGGRPASGLSRRRTQFRGPPPSFYRSGGWGAYGAKREENAYKASSSWEARGESASGASGPAAGENPSSYSAGGTGPGGFTQGFDNDVRHFDQRGHQRTHSHIERNRHRARRRSAKGISEAEIDYSGGNPTVFNFVVVGGVLVLILGITRGIFGWGERKVKKKVKESEEGKGDGSAGPSKS